MKSLAALLFVCSGSLVLSGSGAEELPDKSSFLVEGLEEIEPAFGLFEGDFYSGRLPIDNGDRTGEIMFWLFEPDETTVKDSLVIWLNGGPGCSSIQTGALFELSPITVPLVPPGGECCDPADAPLTYNKFAWTNATAMLFVEQPVGTGFSTGSEFPADEDDVSGDFYAWLLNFYQVFPSFLSHKLYIFGESYAGMYVPSIAHRIFVENKSRGEGIPAVPLTGIALGNGWVDAKIQGPATIDYAYWHGMIDMHTQQSLHAVWERCQEALSMGENVDEYPFHNFNVPDDCGMMEGVLMAAGAGAVSDFPYGPNTYDVTTWDPYLTLEDVDWSTSSKFMNDPAIKELLHAPQDVEWHGCRPGAGRRRLFSNEYLVNDYPESTAPYMADLLDGGVRVLVYNGDRDLSTCAQGSEIVLNEMEWSGADQWLTAKRGLWVVENRPAGYSKKHKDLEFLVVYNSGHMVPSNQPVNALNLVTRFIKNESFADFELPSFDAALAEVSSAARTAKVAKRGNRPPHVLVLGLLVCLCSFVAGYVVSSFRQGQRSSYDKIPDGNNGV